MSSFTYLRSCSTPNVVFKSAKAPSTRFEHNAQITTSGRPFTKRIGQSPWTNAPPSSTLRKNRIICAKKKSRRIALDLIHTRTHTQKHDPDMGGTSPRFTFSSTSYTYEPAQNGRSREGGTFPHVFIFSSTLYTHAPSPKRTIQRWGNISPRSTFSSTLHTRTPTQTHDPDRGHMSTIFQSGARTCRFLFGLLVYNFLLSDIQTTKKASEFGI